jgi:hypothetical protein
MHVFRAATFNVENSAQVLSCSLKFVHASKDGQTSVDRTKIGSDFLTLKVVAQMKCHKIALKQNCQT